MEETTKQEISEKYNNAEIERIKAEMAKNKAEEEARIKDGIRWGDKNKPIQEGDFLIGEVTAIEAGKDKDTAGITFVTIAGKCSIEGLEMVGDITMIANSIIKTHIDNGIIRKGKRVSILFEGLKTGKKWKTPYKLYRVLPLE